MKPETAFTHLTTLYGVLKVQSENGTFTGSKTDVYVHDAKLPPAYYTQLFYYLTEMGCIDQTQRGARGRPSIIRLVKEPTREDFDAVYVPTRFRRQVNLTEGKSIDTLQEEVDELRRRIPNIDMTSWIASVEARLSQLEGG